MFVEDRRQLKLFTTATTRRAAVEAQASVRALRAELRREMARMEALEDKPTSEWTVEDCNDYRMHDRVHPELSACLAAARGRLAEALSKVIHMGERPAARRVRR